MRIWTTFILINIIYLTHVSTAPVNKGKGSGLTSKFGNIADAIINPKWTLNEPDSKKKDKNNDTDSNKQNDENNPNPSNDDTNDPNPSNDDTNDPNPSNDDTNDPSITNSDNDDSLNDKKPNHNKKRKKNNKKKNNKPNGKSNRNQRGHTWYKMVTVEDLLGNLPEYINHEDEQKIVLTWDEEQKIVLDEHFGTFSMNNLNDNQFIRQKRDYNNKLELQDNRLQTKIDNQYDLEENENKEDKLKIENKENFEQKNINTNQSKGQNSFEEKLSLIDNLDEDENSMNSNSSDNINENKKFLNFKKPNDNKFKDMLKNRKQPTNTLRNKKRQPNQGKKPNNINENVSNQEIITSNLPNSRDILVISYDEPELPTETNGNIAKKTPVNDEIETLMNTMNSNSEEDSDEKNSTSHSSSLKTPNEIPNYSVIEDNKQHNILKNIKHNKFKPKSRKLGKRQIKENEKLPEIKKKKISNPSRLSTINKKGLQPKNNTPITPSKNDQTKPSIDNPKTTDTGITDKTQDNPVNNEIDALMNVMNSNSEEDSESRNSGSNTSLSERQLDIPNYSDIEDNKGHNIIKNIKHNKFKPKSRKLGKNRSKKNEKGSQPKSATPKSPSKSNQQTPSIAFPKTAKAGNADDLQGIPGNDEIDALMNAMNSGEDEDSADKNSESNPSSFEIKQDIPDEDDLGDRKERDIVKNIKHPVSPKSKKQGKIGPNKDKKLPQTNKQNLNSPSGVKNNDVEGLQPKSATLESPSKSNQQTPSIAFPKTAKAENADDLQGIPGNDEIDALMNAMNSDDEDSADKNSESNPSSFEIKQDIPDEDDLGDRKERDIVKNIKHPVSPKSKKQGKIGPNKDKELPQTNKQNLNSPSGVKNNDVEGLQPKSATPKSPSKSNQQTPSIAFPKTAKAENADDLQGIPGNDEIDALMNAMNSDDEDSADKNSESNPSSFEIKQDIPDEDDLGDRKERDIVKNIKHPVSPKSKKQGKIGPNKDKELPQTNKQNLNSPSGVKNNDVEGLQPKSATPKSPSKSNQQTPSIAIPKTAKAENADDLQGIPGNDEIDALMNAMNSGEDEDSADKNSESNPSSFEIKQDIPDEDDLGDRKERDIVKNIKHPVSPKSKKQGEIGPNKDKKLPDTNKAKPNPLQKNKPFKKLNPLDKTGLKTPESADDIFPTESEELKDFLDEIPYDDIDESNTLEDINNFGGTTMEDIDKNKNKDSLPSSKLNNNKNKDHDKNPQKTNQPTSLNSNTGKSIPESNVGDNNKINSPSPSTPTGIKQNPESPSDIQDKKNLDDRSDADIIDDLLDSPIGLDGKYSPKKLIADTNNIPDSKIDNKLQNANDDTLTKSPAENDIQPNPLQKNKPFKKMNPLDKTGLKTPESADDIFPTESEELKDFLDEIPYDDIDESNTLEDINNFGGTTMEDIDKNKNKDSLPSSKLNNNKNKDHDKNPQKTNQPTSLNSNTGKSIPESNVGDNNKINSPSPSTPTGIKQNSESPSDIQDKKNLDDRSDADIIDDLLDSPLGLDGKYSPKKLIADTNNIPDSKIDNKLQNANDYTLTKSPAENDIQPNPLQKNKPFKKMNPLDKTGLKTPESADDIFPTESEELKDFLDEIPYDDIDESNTLEDINNFGGTTMEDIDKNKNKDSLPSSKLNNNKNKDHDKNPQKTNQPTSLNSNTGKSIPESNVGDNNKINSPSPSTPTGIKQNPESPSDIQDKKNLDDRSDADIIDDLLDSPLGLDGKYSPKKLIADTNNIPDSKIDNKLQNANDYTLTKSPAENDIQPNPLQKNKPFKKLNPLDKTGLKTPESADDIFPTESEELKDFLDEIPYDDIDESNTLEDINNFGGTTMEDIDKNKNKDSLPSSKLNNNKNKDHDKNPQKTNQPTSLNSNTGKSIPESNVGDNNKINSPSPSTPTGIKQNPESPSDIQEKMNLDDRSDADIIDDLLDSPIGLDGKYSPKKLIADTNNIPDSKIDNKLQNANDDTLTKSPAEDDIQPNPLQKNKPFKKMNPLDKTGLKTPESADDIFPTESEELKDFLDEIPYDDIDESNTLEDINNFGGTTMKDIDKNKNKDSLPSSKLNNNKNKDHDKNPQKTNQPTSLNSNTGKSIPESNVGDNNKINSPSPSTPTGIKQNPESPSDIQDKKNLDDRSDADIIDDLLDSPLGLDGKYSPKKLIADTNNIPDSKIDNKLQNANDYTLTKSPAENDIQPNPLQKNKPFKKLNPLDKTGLKTPESADDIFPTESEELKDFLDEIPYDDIDESNTLEDINNLGGTTMEDIDKNKNKDSLPSSKLNNNKNKDHDKNPQKTNQPSSLNSNTGKSIPESNVGDNNKINSPSPSTPTGIKQNPESPSDIQEKINLDDTSDADIIDDLLDSPIGLDGKYSPKKLIADTNNIPDSKIDNKLQNANDDTLTKSPAENDIQPNPLQKNKPFKKMNPLDKTGLKTPESADDIFPTESEELKDFLDEIPYDDIDESNTLEDINNFGGTTMEDIDKNKNKDSLPSSKLNNNKNKDHDKNPQKTNQPTSLNSNTGKSIPESNVGDNNKINSPSPSTPTGIKQNPESPSDIQEKMNLDDRSDADIIDDLLDSPIGLDGKYSPKKLIADTNNIPDSKIDNKLQNANDDTLTKSPAENDIQPNPLQKNKPFKKMNPLDKTSLKTPESADDIFPTESEELKDFLDEIPYDDIDESNTLEDNNFGGTTMEDIDKNKNKDSLPSSKLNNNKNKDHDKNPQKTNQPTSLNSNTGKSIPESNVGDNNKINSPSPSTPTGIKQNPESPSDIQDKINLEDTSDSNTLNDLLGSPEGLDGVESPKLVIDDTDIIPIPEIDDILHNSNDNTLTTTSPDANINTVPLLKDKSTEIISLLEDTDLKTPEITDGIVPTEADELKEFLAEIPYDDDVITDISGEYNNLGGFTMEDSDVKSNPDNNVGDDKNINSPSPSTPADIKENPKNLSDIQDKINLEDTSDSNTLNDLLGSPEGLDGVESPKLVIDDTDIIPIPEIDDILHNSNDNTLTTTSPDADINTVPLLKDKSTEIISLLENTDLKTPEITDGIVPTEADELKEFLAEIPYDDDVITDISGEYNNLGGFTMEDSDVKSNPDNNVGDDKNINSPSPSTPADIKENPKNLSDIQDKINLEDTSDSNTLNDLLGSPEGLDGVESPKLVIDDTDIIPIPEIDDILHNSNDNTLTTTSPDADINTVPLLKDKSTEIISLLENTDLKTPEITDGIVPTEADELKEFLAEIPYDDDVITDISGEYNNLGGFTMEDSDVKSNPDNNVGDDKNINSPSPSTPADIKDDPKNLSVIQDKINLEDTSDSNTLNDLLGSPEGLDGVESPKPVIDDTDIIPISEIDDILHNSNDNTLTTTSPDDDINTVPLLKDKSTEIISLLEDTDLKTPEITDGIVPTEADELKEFLAEIPYDDDVITDISGEYNNLGGFTMEDSDVKSNPDNNVGDDKNINSPSPSTPADIKDDPKNLSVIQDKINLEDTSDSNTLNDLLGSPEGLDGVESPKPVIDDTDIIPISEIDDILHNSNDNTLTTTSPDDDINTVPLLKDKSTEIISLLEDTDLKSPEITDGIVPTEADELKEFLAEIPYDEDVITDISGEYNNLGGFTMEDSDVKSNPDNNVGDDKNINSPSPSTPADIKENPKNLSVIQDKINLEDTSDSNTLNDLLGSPEGLDGVESPRPVIDDTDIIPISEIDDILHNSNDNTLTTTSPDADINTVPLLKDKSTEIISLLEDTDLKSPEITVSTVPLETDDLKKFLAEIPHNYDTSDIGEEYNNLGLIMEDIDKNKIKDNSLSPKLNNIKNKDHNDSPQKINQPTSFNSNTGKFNPVNAVGDNNNINSPSPSTPTGIKENPKKIPERQDKINLYETSDSNIIDDLLGSPIGLDESSNSAIDDTNIIPKSEIDNKLHNSKEDTSTLRPVSDKLKNDNKTPLSEISLNGIDRHSSGLNLMHNYNYNKLDNGDAINVNHGYVTNPMIDYNSNDAFSLEGDNPYGYMIPKFSTKYIDGGDSNYNLWETIPPKRNYDINIHNGYDNYINDLNQSTGYPLNNNKIPSHINNEKNIVTETETVKNNYNDIVNTDNHDSHDKLYDDFIKKMSEQLLNKIDNIDDKLSKLDKLSKNCSCMRENDNIGSHDSSINKVVLINDIPITKPEKLMNIEESDSNTNKPIESLEIKISNKSVDGNETKDSTKAKKHKNKKHGKHNKKKDHKKNNISNDDDDDDDGDDDDYSDDDDNDDDVDNNSDDDGTHEKSKLDKIKDTNDDDGKHKKKKRHKNKNINNDDDSNHKKNKHHKSKDLINDDKGKHKKNKRRKNKDINDDDNGEHIKNKGKHKKNKRRKNKDINENDDGEHLKNKGRKKNIRIDDNNDDDGGGHKKKNHKKKHFKDDDNDDVGRHKKNKSHNKNDLNDEDVEIFRSKNTDNRKKKIIKKNIYSSEENNEVNGSSIQINSDDNDSLKRLKIKNNKSKISKKTNSNNSKKLLPKEKSKYLKHSKTIKYKNKKIPVDVSDEDTNENNYNSEETYVKYNQNNVLKDKKHKNKKHNKYLKTSKTYNYKEIPVDNEDKSSDENNVNLEETYNINITSDDDALKQKKLRHKKIKKQKNIDINIVKDTDTQVLNNDNNTNNGYKFYTFYPQYRYTNPFSRLFY
ncbi:protein PFC0760c-like isoform X2 [Rhopalosiphum padi]|uniref:protein PFC0760c-like isoform X2 n=1 Tax=Rhopalosiphum padi TaxID=40932 RepID=UPI00298DBCA1|nr:protein PFC0760c-like isoform X2 [Rhopalosiphum padi]